MARKRYIETHSNYTLKKLHQTTSKGNVYESDLMTITELGAFAPGQVPIYADHNFKMSVGRGLNQKLKHEHEPWVINNNCEVPSEIWTSDCLEDNLEDSSSNKIILKPDYTDILDFVCFGSAREFIRAELMDIIMRFPAELFLTNEHYQIFESPTSKKLINLGGDDKFIVHNPFQIKVDATEVPEKEKTYSMRYLSESWMKYERIGLVQPIYCPGQGFGDPIKWHVIEVTAEYCAEDGDLLTIIETGGINFYYYYYKGQKILLHDYQGGGVQNINGINEDEWDVTEESNTLHIRPTSDVIEAFFNSLDDFQKIILNRETGYKFRLKTPRETDKGIFVSLETYQWPVIDGWNLDIESRAYTEFINSLYDIADIYDKYYTDVIVRELTHEAIKNMDWTHTKKTSEMEEVIENPNPYRMEAILHIYGRLFDFLKLYARNIRTANAVTYSEKNNTPDYFLKRGLELSGWEVKNILSGSSIYTDSKLYPTTKVGYSFDDANNRFLRTLKLSSAQILRAKGTKRGIEMLMALFGMHSLEYYQKRFYDNGRRWGDLSDEEKRKYYRDLYQFKEYVGVAYNTGNTSTIGYENCNDLKVRRINARKDGYELPVGNYNSVDEVELQGLPVKSVSLMSGDTEIRYLVPWYDKAVSQDVYFQAKGGWCKTPAIYTQVATYGEIELLSDNELQLYEETHKNIHYALNLADLLSTPYTSLTNGDIYYVEDIAGLEKAYKADYQSLSHYFILKDIEFCNNLGTDENGNWGWRNVGEDEIKNQSSLDGKMILYAESIKNDRKANNPHIGGFKYDDGKEYIDHFKHIFEHCTFNSVSDKSVEGYENVGFDIEIQQDNNKCWYFTDTTKEDTRLLELFEEEPDYYTSQDMEEVRFEDDARLRTTIFTPYNMEGNGVSHDEAAANSVINIKNFAIEFYPNPAPGSSLYDFIKNVLMYYAKQLIPSTSIFEFKVPDTWSNPNAPQHKPQEKPEIIENISVNPNILNVDAI